MTTLSGSIHSQHTARAASQLCRCRSPGSCCPSNLLLPVLQRCVGAPPVWVWGSRTHHWCGCGAPVRTTGVGVGLPYARRWCHG
jgi:hypothetical protein